MVIIALNYLLIKIYTMKKILYVSTVMACLSSGAYAVDSTGCGLGSTVFKGQRGVIPQILAVTTNGTSANQTFGITSGTLGCDPNGRITGGTGKVLVFLENNVDAFAFDVAKGNGETIDAIAQIAKIDSKEAAKILKDNFNELFADENVDVVALSEQVAKLLNIA